MSYTLVREDEAPWAKMARPFIKVLRLAYIQGTTVVKLLPSERAIQLYYKYRRKSYDLQWAMDPGYRKGLNRLVQMTVTDADRVLDVGCGTGSATVIAAANAKGRQGRGKTLGLLAQMTICQISRRQLRRDDAVRHPLGIMPVTHQIGCTRMLILKQRRNLPDSQANGVGGELYCHCEPPTLRTYAGKE